VGHGRTRVSLRFRWPRNSALFSYRERHRSTIRTNVEFLRIRMPGETSRDIPARLLTYLPAYFLQSIWGQCGISLLQIPYSAVQCSTVDNVHRRLSTDLKPQLLSYWCILKLAPTNGRNCLRVALNRIIPDWANYQPEKRQLLLRG